MSRFGALFTTTAAASKGTQPLATGGVIVAGMGGSGIAGQLAQALAERCGGLRVHAWNDYGLPAWANGSERLIAVSYSGNTAETLSGVERAIELGCKWEAITTGVLAGYAIENVSVTLYDGSSHDVDSSELAFKIAASMAFRAAARRASPVLLEPVMKVEVVVPEAYLGDVIADLNSRRGKVKSMEARGGTQIVNARVPLAEMFGYATDLRSRTQGRATYTMHFARYEQVPQTVSEEIMARIQGREKG